jgi:hypothetical protein
LTTGGKRRDAASHPLRFSEVRWQAKRDTALVPKISNPKRRRRCALPAHSIKKEKAAEPGREALAAF